MNFYLAEVTFNIGEGDETEKFITVGKDFNEASAAISQYFSVDLIGFSIRELWTDDTSLYLLNEETWNLLLECEKIQPL